MMAIMTRLQIRLEERTHRAVKRVAKRLGVSVSEVVRRCVARQLRADEAETPDARSRHALAALGRYADPAGPGNVAGNHDAVLAGTFKQ